MYNPNSDAAAIDASALAYPPSLLRSDEHPIDPGLEHAPVSDITERLHSVCANMPEEEFRALVHDIARVKMRYAAKEGITITSGDVSHAPLAD